MPHNVWADPLAFETWNFLRCHFDVPLDKGMDAKTRHGLP